MKEDKWRKRIFDFYKIFLWTCLICVFLYFFVGEMIFSPDNQIDGIKVKTLSENWYETKTGKSITLPYQVEAKKNEMVSVSGILPDEIDKEDYLCLRSSKQEMQIYIDGELRKEYKKESKLVGKTSPVLYVFVKVNPDDAGKIVRVDTKSNTSYTGLYYPAYFGNKIGIISVFFKQSGVEMLVAGFVLVMGFICIFAGLFVKYYMKRDNELAYLGWGVSLSAVWLITNSTFRQIIFPNLSVVNDIPFYMIMLLPITFLVYINKIQNYRYSKLYALDGLMLVINSVVCVILHMLEIVDYSESIKSIAIVCIITIILMTINVFRDFRKGKTKEYRWVAIGLFCAFISACIQIGVYFYRVVQFNGITLSFGLMLLLIASVIETANEIIKMDKQKNKAQMESEARAKFLANMSHEIRTPINAIIGMNAMILRESKERETKEYAQDIKNASQTLLTLVNEILDSSKIESGKMEIIPSEYDFCELIHDVYSIASINASEKSLAVELDIDEDIPTRLYGDEVRIRQILTNIVNNAIKYTKEGSVTVVVNSKREENEVILHYEVTDTGIGIKEEDMPKLFAAFERIEEHRNRTIEGTGLGMAIVVQLLKLMDSKLDVKSVYGKGTTFSFDLRQGIVEAKPIGDVDIKASGKKIENEQEKVFVAEKSKILVVDDNYLNLKVFKSLLKQHKAYVDEATSGFECLELIEKNEYDVIFLDHMMPEMDGIETIKKIKSSTSHKCTNVPIIALTANAISGAKEMYLSEGFDDFLSKPIIPKDLEKILQKYLTGNIIIENSNTNGADNLLPTIEGINWEYAKIYNPNIDELKELVDTFYKLMNSVDREIREYAENIKENIYLKDNMNLYKTRIHSVKSASASLGAIHISGLARVLEYAARDERVDEVLSLTPVFLREWNVLRENIGEVFGTEEKIEKKKISDINYVKKLFEKLNEAMEELDLDTADTIIEEIQLYEFDEAMGYIIRELAEAVLALNNDKVEILVEKCLKDIEKQE